MKRDSRNRWSGGLVGTAVGLGIALAGIYVVPGLLRDAPVRTMVVLGLYVAVRSWIPVRSIWNRRAMVLESIVVGLYISLVLVELVVMAFAIGGPRYTPKDPLLGLQGLYVEDSAVGYRNVPNFRGAFDDGRRRSPLATNSLGDRDDEPAAPSEGVTRVLMIGDSFAFGFNLSREDSIEGRLEALGDDALDVYNQSAIGYSTSNMLARLEEAEWWQGSAVLYLFFNNDLADLKTHHYAVVDGLLADRYVDGVPMPEEEARRQAQRYRATYPWLNRISRVLLLQTIRELIAGWYEEQDLDVWPGMISTRSVAAVVERTLSIRDLADERGAEFLVAIIPSRREAGAGRYSRNTLAFVDALRGHGTEPIEMLELLDASDYFPVDRHLNPEGARKASEAIFERLAQDFPDLSR